MQSAPKPDNESARLNSLRRYQLLDTVSEGVYDDITQIASEICGTPISLLSLIDESRQWNKSTRGTKLKEFERELSFCAHAILQPEELFIVSNTHEDERFHDNPFTTGEMKIQFYAGMPLVDSDGLPLGVLCVLDSRPRELSEEKLKSLKSLAKLVEAHFELRLANIRLQESNDRLMLAVPLVDTVLNEIDMLSNSNPSPEQESQLEILKDTTMALKSLFMDEEVEVE
ncbi:GAF domain-containing protein [Telluribacter sp. SYSU D00476]|uniref:GAF domain-containing protein n=1 Tax=Telluribacter sp. SYSU D00476 TaxID=2811430 RepID=UPI001FF63731|nr:GAF domain-containing protein [Telluribacter sp. SYSU D00476]